MKTQIYFISTLLLLISCSGSQEESRLDNIESDQATSITTNNESYVSINEDATLDNSQSVTFPRDVLQESVQNHLSRMGKSLNTINDDGTVYAIGTATTAVPLNSSGFITSRNIAYARAELRAKLNVLRLSNEQITSERSSTLIDRAVSGTDPDAKQKATMLDKATRIVDASLDKALSELGVSSSEIAKMNQQEKERVYEETFYNYVSSFVSGLIRGITTLKIIEGESGNNDYQVAVLVKYDPEIQNLAANYPDLGADKEQLNSSVVNQLRTIDPEKLISKMGAQIFELEDNSRVVIGYGQSTYRNSSQRQSNQESIAFRRSRLQAVENIKNMIAEDLISKEVSESVEKVVEYADGTGSMYTEDNYSELIESRASTLAMNTLELRQWKSSHPVSNHIIIGSIVILTEDVGGLSGNLNGQGSSSKTSSSEFLESDDLEGEDW